MESKGYFIHKNPILDPVLTQMNSVHIFTPYFFNIFILFSCLYVGFVSGLFPSGFLPKILYTVLIFSMCATFMLIVD